MRIYIAGEDLESEAIAAASLYKEIEAAGVARMAQPYKAQNA